MVAQDRAGDADPLALPTGESFDLVGYRTVLQQGDFLLYFQTSMVVTVASLVFVLLFGAMAPADRAQALAQAAIAAQPGVATAIADVLAANPDKLAEYRAGKDKLFGFFVGQTMKAMQGKANPAVVNELLKKALG